MREDRGCSIVIWQDLAKATMIKRQSLAVILGLHGEVPG